MANAKVEAGDNSWLHIHKSGAEIWLNGRKLIDGKFTVGQQEFQIAGNLPVRAEIYIRPVTKKEIVRSWEM